MLLIIISDEPFVTEEYQRVDCDARCKFLQLMQIRRQHLFPWKMKVN